MKPKQEINTFKDMIGLFQFNFENQSQSFKVYIKWNMPNLKC